MENSSANIVHLHRLETDSPQWQEVVSFVIEYDKEFFPPISERMPVREYIERFRSDNGIVIAALDADSIVGLMASFLKHPERGTPFVQYAAVATEYRKSGLAVRLLQRTLAELTAAGGTCVESRTWSTNTGSQRLLISQGFAEVERLLDDRAPGVATLIFARPL